MEPQDNGQNIAAEMQKMVLEDTANTVEELIRGSDSMPFQAKLGVLQRVVTAVLDDKEYRQVLLLAAFDNKQEALLCADAIAECRRYGVPIERIVDRVIAEGSVNSEKMNKVLAAVTSYTLNTNTNRSNLPFWKRKQERSGLS